MHALFRFNLNNACMVRGHIISVLIDSHYPANTKHLNNMCTTSAQRLRRWSSLYILYANVLCLMGIADLLTIGNFAASCRSSIDVPILQIKTLHYIFNSLVHLFAATLFDGFQTKTGQRNKVKKMTLIKINENDINNISSKINLNYAHTLGITYN